ncbi:hypothetical protein B0H16DRAFT_1462790 [Mycena metata]|uniref:Uncharacterized protein n=1 Tax=Mycena metata TaxID=1033252 RepID=A0AAD7IN65_9AGAR|nr:hypothetical protein B0H16DRAFT_1462790 [Mycena metata]
MRGKSCLFRIFLCLHSALAALVTTILDDAFAGDSQSSITYSPSNVWVLGSSTNHGRIAPDPSQAFDSTWHDATDDTTANHDGTTPLFMEVNFQGTGIDIRCMIANNLADPSIPPFTGTKANYSFFVDNVPQNKDFLHEAGTTGDAFLYNTSVFATSGLSAAPHTLKLLLNGGPEVNGSVLLLFDYAIVTSDDASTSAGPVPTPVGGTTSATFTSTTNAKVNSGASSLSGTPTSSRSSAAASIPAGSSSPTGPGGVTQASQSPTSRPSPSPSSPVPFPAVHNSHIGPIIGGVVGGLLALILLLLCLWSRRKRSRRLRLPTISPFTNPHAPSARRTRFSFRSFISTRKRASVPSAELPSPPARKHPPSQSPPSTEPAEPPPDAESNSATPTRDDVLRLRAEVDRLRAQLEPPPQYSQ